MQKLPDELIIIILENINLKDLLNFKLVNKQFSNFIKKVKWNKSLVIDKKNHIDIDEFLKNHKFNIIQINNYPDIKETAKYLCDSQEIILINSYINIKYWKYLASCRSINYYSMSNMNKKHAYIFNDMKLETLELIVLSGIYREFFENLNLKYLKSFIVKGNSFELCKKIVFSSQLPNLEELTIKSGDLISNEILDIISNNFKKLKKLDISHLSYCTSNLNQLVNLKNLTNLSINGNDTTLDDESILYLSSLVGLTDLNLKCYKFNIKSSYLYLSNLENCCFYKIKKGILKFLEFPKLKSLELDSSSLESFENLSFPLLEKLIIKNIKISREIKLFINHLKLKYLDIKI